MLRKLLFPFIFLFFYAGMHGQDKNEQLYTKAIDSMLKQLPEIKVDSLRAKSLLSLASYSSFINKNTDAERYANDALALSKKINFYPGKAGSYLIFAEIYRDTDELKERNYLFLALKEAKQAARWKGIAYFNRFLGLNYQATDFKTAEKYFKQSADIYFNHKKYEEYCESAIYLAYLYSNKNKLTEAADICNKIIEIAGKYKYEVHLARAQTLLTGVYMSLGNNDKAIEYILDLLKKSESGKASTINTCVVLKMLVNLYEGKKDTKNAAVYSKRLKDCKANDEPDALVKEYNTANAYFVAGNSAKALEAYDKAAKSAFENKRNNVLTDIAEDCFDLKDYNRALQYHQQALDIVRSRNIPEPIAAAEINVGATCVTLAKENNDKMLLERGIALLEKTIKFYSVTKDYRMLQMASYYLSKGYEQAGLAQKALEVYKNSIIYRDSLENRNEREALITKQAEYEYNKKEALLKASQKSALDKEQTNRNYAFAGIGILLLIAVGAGVAYSRKRKDNRTIAAEKKRSDDLLLNILPAEVAEELKAKGEASAQYYDKVSIIFTDFVGFTKLSEKFSPEELIGELNYCFKAFDNIITKHNIEKIKTIGDSYMAVSGLPGKNPDHAKNAVEAAIEMRNFIVDYKAEREAQGRVYFEMRIGINSGKVVAGIVGIKKFAYDVWGDAVNIASRMETYGQAGKINISESTYNLVKDDYAAQYRGELDAKGKGLIKMYFVEPKQVPMDINRVKDFILAKQQEGLPNHLTYHSVEHIQDVYDAVNRHIAAASITGDDAVLLQTAALFHDSGFMDEATGHEEISCGFARQYLPDFGYSTTQIEAICGMIMATKIPQQPQTPLEEILADADLDYLGRDDFEGISNGLFEELKHSGVVKNEDSWNRMQVRFFESHHYFTANAKAWRDAKKQENLQTIKNKLITL